MAMIPWNSLIAANFQSSNFDVRDPVISDFGGKSTSNNFEQYNTGGGQSVTGESNSTNFTLRSGFFYFDTFAPKSQNWRWYDDETSVTPATALAAENVAPSNIANLNTIKLRMTLKETASIGGTIKLKLQFSKNSNFASGIIDAVSSGACTTYSRWCYADGGGADNGVVTTKLLTDVDACSGGVGNGCGTHNESGTSAATFNHKKDAATEYEFTVKANNPEFNQTYFFRAFDVTNNIPVPLNTGESYPSLSVEGTTLTFTIDGVGSGTATEGVTTDIATTATTIPFGTLTVNAEIEAAQRLTVTTNAPNGYQIFLKETQQFQHTGYGAATVITPVSATNAAPAAWALASGAFGAYGYHAGDDTLSSGSTRFAVNNTYAKLESVAKEIAFASAPVTAEIVDTVYKVQITGQQEAGNYSTTIQYIIVPTF